VLFSICCFVDDSVKQLTSAVAVVCLFDRVDVHGKESSGVIEKVVIAHVVH